MKNNASFVYGFCLIVLDFLALLSAFVFAYVVRVKIDERPLIEFVPARYYFGTFLVLLVFWIGIFALLGLYNNSIYEKRFKEFGRLLTGSFLGLLFVLSVAYFSDETIFPARLVPVYGFIFALTLVVTFRTIARFVRSRLFRYGIGINNLLIVGNNQVTQELVDLFKDSSSGYKIIGIAGHRGELDGHVRHFQDFDEATTKLQATDVNAIIQTELFSSAAKNNQILDYAQQNHISYRFIPGNTELFVGNIDVELFRSSIPVIAVNQTALSGWGRIVKRLFDIIVTLPLLITLSPVFIICGLIIMIDLGSPIYVQKRVTRFNRIFKIYKFRSMKRQYNGLSPEAAFKKMGRPELIRQYRDQGDYIANDPRLTKIGRVMRILSLDELPQLINVLKGDISLVGPRALVPDEIKLAKNKHHIMSVKSGLTGLAQVSGRRDISFEERRKLDLYYVQNWSFWLDITILIKTLKVVVAGRGAR